MPNFLICLRDAREFMEQPEDPSALQRFKKLQSEVLKTRALLAFEPTSGRPARFLAARAAWGRFQAEQAREMARVLGQPEIRELVLACHVLVYAHSAQEVTLLSIRHERQWATERPVRRVDKDGMA